MKLSVLAAVANNGVIGKRNKLPWKLREDMRHFAAETKRIGTVIVGRITFQSIMEHTGGVGLVGRQTIVVTTNPSISLPKGVIRVSNFLQSLKSVEDTAVVIGGSRLYEEAIPYADELILSFVDASPEGDAYFPKIIDYEWDEVNSFSYLADEKNEYPFRVAYFDRQSAYVYLPNARTREQEDIMRQIRADGVCPFCRQHLQTYHLQPILAEGDYWVFSASQYPRDHAESYIMAFYKESHITQLAELPPKAGFELIELSQSMSLPPNGCWAMRFGSPQFTGATIYHLHAHLIFPKPGLTPVRFKIGAN